MAAITHFTDEQHGVIADAGSQQRAHRDRLIRILRDSGVTSLADRLESCGRPEFSARLGRNRRAECGVSFCPNCRYKRMIRRKRSYLPLFAAVPPDAIGCGTVLFDVHDRLDRMAPVDAKLESKKVAVSVPEAKLAVDRHRHAYGEFLRSLLREGRIDGCVQAGAIEFALHARADKEARRGSHCLAFMGACGDLPAAWDDLWVSHAHFLLAAHGRGRFLSRQELRQMLDERYAKPHQLRIARPQRRGTGGIAMTDAAALSGWLGYSLKSFSDFRPERLVELAVFDMAVSPRFYAFNRCSENMRSDVHRERQDGTAERARDAGDLPMLSE